MKRLPLRVVRRKSKEPQRKALLRMLKLRGELSVNELCKALGVTHTAVRRHLCALQSDGLIAATSVQQSKGRPVYKYRLTEHAAACFPSDYENLAEELLDTVFEAGGHKSVMDILKSNNDRVIAASMPIFAGKTLQERVMQLAEYFAGKGYMTDWFALPGGKFFMFHQNCAVYKLASRYRQICILEPRLIECVLDAKVSRQQYILKGQPICGYLITGGEHHPKG